MPIKEMSLQGWYEVIDLGFFIFNPKDNYSNLRRLANHEANALEKGIIAEDLDLDEIKTIGFYHPPNPKKIRRIS